jgi:hypothetical protein
MHIFKTTHTLGVEVEYFYFNIQFLPAKFNISTFAIPQIPDHAVKASIFIPISFQNIHPRANAVNA